MSTFAKPMIDVMPFLRLRRAEPREGWPVTRPVTETGFRPPPSPEVERPHDDEVEELTVIQKTVVSFSVRESVTQAAPATIWASWTPTSGARQADGGLMAQNRAEAFWVGERARNQASW